MPGAAGCEDWPDTSEAARITDHPTTPARVFTLPVSPVDYSESPRLIRPPLRLIQRRPVNEIPGCEGQRIDAAVLWIQNQRRPGLPSGVLRRIYPICR